MTRSIVVCFLLVCGQALAHGPAPDLTVQRLDNGTVYIVTIRDSTYQLDSARYSIFIPDGVSTLQAAFIHQHGCTMEGRGMSSAFDIQYQAFARKWNLAIVGPDLYSAKGNCHDWKNPSSGSGPALLRALKEVSKKAQHPELVETPWLLWGHSGGGYWSQAMLRDQPQRVLAVFSYSPGLNPDWAYPREAANVPVMIRYAGVEGDACCFQSALNSYRALKKIDGLVSISHTRHQNHNYSYVRYMAIRFFESLLHLRLPVGADKSYRAMQKIDRSLGWWCDTTNLNIYPVGNFKADTRAASWLPDSTTANIWREYVLTGTVVDHSPPPPPYHVQIKRRHNVTVEISWKAEADVESGISHFNIYKGDRLVARFPQSGNYQQFDTNGDDAFPIWLPPLRADITLLWNDSSKLSVTTVNHFGLESPRTGVR